MLKPSRFRFVHRAATAVAVACFVLAVSKVAYLEASVLVNVPSPEMSAAALLTDHAPPSANCPG